jgi:hypothetical protein
MSNMFESAGGKLPWRSILVFAIFLVNLRFRREAQDSGAISLTIMLILFLGAFAVLDLLRYFLLRRWEGQTGIAVDADERAILIAHEAASRSFWLTTWAIAMSTWMSEPLGYDWRAGNLIILFAGFIYYTVLELRGRRTIMVRESVEHEPQEQRLN